jgi:hypothetical protein
MGKLAILTNLAQWCAKCNTLFIATVQLFQANVIKNSISGEIVESLKEGLMLSRWYDIVCSSEIEK